MSRKQEYEQNKLRRTSQPRTGPHAVGNAPGYAAGPPPQFPPHTLGPHGLAPGRVSQGGGGGAYLPSLQNSFGGNGNGNGGYNIGNGNGSGPYYNGGGRNSVGGGRNSLGAGGSGAYASPPRANASGRSYLNI